MLMRQIVPCLLALALAGCVESSRYLVCGDSVYGSEKRVGGSKDVAAPAPAARAASSSSSIKENTTIVVRPSSWDVALSTSVDATCTTSAVPSPTQP